MCVRERMELEGVTRVVYVCVCMCVCVCVCVNGASEGREVSGAREERFRVA